MPPNNGPGLFTGLVDLNGLEGRLVYACSMFSSSLWADACWSMAQFRGPLCKYHKRIFLLRMGNPVLRRSRSRLEPRGAALLLFMRLVCVSEQFHL